MALAHFIPEIWSGRILARLNKALVYRGVCTTEYEGDIAQFGDVVKINEIGPVTVNTYSSTSTGALTVQQLSDAQKLLKIDQAKYFAFWLDDVDAAQTKPKVMEAAMGESAFALANNIDYYISRLYGDAGLAVGGTSSSGVDVSSTNVMKYMSLAQQKLDETNTPMMGRWMVVPPWFAQKLTLSRIALDTNNSAALNAGFFGRTIYGFDVYVSNQVYHASGTDRAAILVGYPGSVALAVQVLATRQEPSGTIGFKTLVKGLVVYGAKVIRPNNLGVLWADYTAEAT
jgi:hypothetical protein